MGNLVIIGIVAVLIGAAVRFLVRTKKRGAGCIGCPSSGACRFHCENEKGKERKMGL